MSDEPYGRRRAGASTPARMPAAGDGVLAAAEEASRRLRRPLRVVDLGGGTGQTAVPLARAGHEVTVVDPSPDALASLARRAREAGVAHHITGRQGDAGALADLLPVAEADLVCCHDVLEYVDDPGLTVAQLAPFLAPGGTLSLVVAQRLAAVVARALAGRFAQAQTALGSSDGRWGSDDPLPRRFDADEVREFVSAAGLDVVEVRGVRLFADLVPAALLDSEADRQALLDLEAAVADHPSYAFLTHVAAALHLLARRP